MKVSTAGLAPNTRQLRVRVQHEKRECDAPPVSLELVTEIKSLLTTAFRRRQLPYDCESSLVRIFEYGLAKDAIEQRARFGKLFHEQVGLQQNGTQTAAPVPSMRNWSEELAYRASDAEAAGGKGSRREIKGRRAKAHRAGPAHLLNCAAISPATLNINRGISRRGGGRRRLPRRPAGAGLARKCACLSSSARATTLEGPRVRVPVKTLIFAPRWGSAGRASRKN